MFPSKGQTALNNWICWQLSTTESAGPLQHAGDPGKHRDLCQNCQNVCNWAMISLRVGWDTGDQENQYQKLDLFFSSCILHDLRKSLPWQLLERNGSSKDLRGWRRAGFISLLPSLTFPLSYPIPSTTPATICSPLSSDISKYMWVRNPEKGDFSSVGRVIAYYVWDCRFGPQHFIKPMW